jgi:hypothetical protein
VPRKLTAVIRDFSKCVRESHKLAADAHNWSTAARPSTVPFVSPKRRAWLIELAFFRAYSAWEAFVEEAFVLYLIGQQALRGRKAHRFGFPPSEHAAREWVNDGRSYTSWNTDQVKRRANRLFRNGHPFHRPLLAHEYNLGQAKTVRNAIAHQSEDAWVKFQALVRNELAAFPPGMTVGSFLMTTKPSTTPPISYFEHYLNQIAHTANQIIPT